MNFFIGMRKILIAVSIFIPIVIMMLELKIVGVGGASLGVVIPKAVLEDKDIKKGDTVFVDVQKTEKLS